MSQYNIGETVIPQQYASGPLVAWDDDMLPAVGKKAAVTAIHPKYNLVKVAGWWWPKYALRHAEPDPVKEEPQRIKPEYTKAALFDFAKAALTGLCANYTGDVNTTAGWAVDLAKATLEKLTNEK